MGKNSSAALAAGVALLLTSVSVPADPAAQGHKMIRPQDLEWRDIQALPPGAKGAVIHGSLDKAGPFIFRMKLPANYQLPPHWHPVVEHLTVLEGAFHMGLGETFVKEKTTKLTAGSVSIMQPKQPHYGYTSEPTVVQGHGVGPWGVTYVNSADDPRNRK